MVAVSNLQVDYALLADMNADRTMDLTQFSASLDRISKPFDPPDWKIGQAFSAEFRMSLPLWDSLNAGTGYEKFGSDTWWTRSLNHFGKFLFKKHATENFRAEKWSRFIEMTNTDPANLDSAHVAYDRWEQSKLSFGARYVYNPVGKLLISVEATSMNNFYKYALKTYDAAAMQRLAKLTYEIRKQQIPRNDIPAFMQQHPEWSTHPVDGHQFAWNSEKGEVTVEPHGEWKKDRRFGVPVW